MREDQNVKRWRWAGQTATTSMPGSGFPHFGMIGASGGGPYEHSLGTYMGTGAGGQSSMGGGVGDGCGTSIDESSDEQTTNLIAFLEVDAT